MTKRRKLLFLMTAAVIFALTSGHRRLKIRTKALEEEVNLLKNDVAELKKIVIYLNNTLQSSCLCKNLTTEPKTNITKENVTVELESNNTRIIQVSRTDIGNGLVNYTVRYNFNHSAHPARLFSYWNRRNKDYTYLKLNGSSARHKISKISRMTESVVTETENQTSVMFVFGSADIWYALHLNNSIPDNITLTNISLPELYVAPEEVVYTPGEKISFQLGMSKTSYEAHGFSASDNLLTVAGTDQFLTFFHDLFHLPKFVFRNDTKTELYVGNVTSAMDVEMGGALTLQSRTNGYNTSLLERIYTKRRFAIRPWNQFGPYGDDIFTFYTRNMNHDSDDDYNVYTDCIVGSPCMLICPHAVGSNKTEMRVWHWDKQVKSKRVQIEGPRIDENPFYVAEFPPVQVPKGVDEMFCEARQIHKPHKKIELSVKIKRASPPEVLNARVRVKGDGAFYKTLRINCFAKGTPLPFIAIQVSCSVGELYFSGSELEIEAQAENHIRVTKDVMLSREYFDQKVNVSCHVHNAVGSDTLELKPVYL